MSLTLALQSALSGLNVNQRALAVLAQNIANANTPGYSRQIVNQSAYYLAGQGAGVRIEDITRKVDTYLQRAIQSQTSEVGKADITNEFMERIQILLGEPGDQNSMDEYIENFFNSLQSLAETPERTSFRDGAVNAGGVLARQLSSLALGLEDLRYQADQDIDEMVDSVNTDLKALFNLNVAIERAYAMGTSTAGLLDQRDTMITNVADKLDIQIYYKESGAVNIFTSNGAGLLDDSMYQLSYEPAPSVDTFLEDGTMKALKIVQYDLSGNALANPVTLVSTGSEETINSQIRSGRLGALVEMRDKTIPGILQQIDTLAAGIRDEINRIHNDGSGYPGAFQLTGTRAVVPSDRNQWTGSVQIALLNQDGSPVLSNYSDEANMGIRPLNLDLSFLDSGLGAGSPSVQTIIDEINNHFGIPENKVKVGNLNNIQLSAISDRLPGVPPQFSFDFDLENISGTDSNFWVTGVTVFDDTNTDITSATSTLPSLSLDGAATYTTTLNSKTVTVGLNGTHELVDGDMVYLSDPGVSINGIPSAEINGYYRIKNVTPTSFEIEVSTEANASGSVGVLSQTALPSYSEVTAGDKHRTRDDGAITLDLIANTTSAFYTVRVNVAVDDGSGNPSTAVIEYRLPNNDVNLRNDRYSATAVTGNGTIVPPGTTQAFAYAIMVDENGVELPKINGKYVDREGFLKIMGADEEYVISIRELDSKEGGLPDNNPPIAGSGRGFSHYFELNNFFKSNRPVSTGDTIEGSAYAMAVEDRIVLDPNLITTGQLTRSNQPTDPNADPLYTYVRNVGDNSVAQRLAKLGISSINFAAAGGLPRITQTFNGYSGELLGYLASQAVGAQADLGDGQILLDGYNQRSNAISGVNLDEELANTIIYQNAYTASARVITVTNELYDALLNAF